MYPIYPENQYFQVLKSPSNYLSFLSLPLLHVLSIQSYKYIGYTPLSLGTQRNQCESVISLIFAVCKVLNIRIMRTFNYNEMPHEVLEMASEYAIKESRSGRGLSHSQAMEKIKEQRGW